MKLKQIKNQGFTIIEVLIVLAIAGLIMLVVFLAVPALQRNNRNQQYRSEASRILGAVNEWSNNNNGAKVTDGTAATNAAAIKTLANTKNFVTVTVSTTAAPAIEGNPTPPVATTDAVTITAGSKCGATAGKIIKGADRQFTVVFPVEDSTGSAQPQCLDS